MISFRNIILAPVRVISELYKLLRLSILQMVNWIKYVFITIYNFVKTLISFTKNGILFVHRALTILYSFLSRISLLVFFIFLPIFVYFDPIGWVYYLYSNTSHLIDKTILFIILISISSFISLSVIFVAYKEVADHRNINEKIDLSKFYDWPSKCAAFLTMVLFFAYIAVFRIDFLIGTTVGSEVRSHIYDRLGYLYAEFEGIPEYLARDRIRTFFGDQRR